MFLPSRSTSIIDTHFVQVATLVVVANVGRQGTIHRPLVAVPAPTEVRAVRVFLARKRAGRPLARAANATRLALAPHIFWAVAVMLAQPHLDALPSLCSRLVASLRLLAVLRAIASLLGRRPVLWSGNASTEFTHIPLETQVPIDSEPRQISSSLHSSCTSLSSSVSPSP